MSDDIQKLRDQIKQARAYAKQVHEARCRLAGVLSGAVGVTTAEFEFPEPDIMHVYLCMFGHRSSEPVVYKLAFVNSCPIRWVGVSHPWGVKPADIEIAL